MSERHEWRYSPTLNTTHNGEVTLDCFQMNTRLNEQDGEISALKGALELAVELHREDEATIERLRKDAERWSYVASLAQSHSLQMDNQHSWRFRQLHYGRGSTIGEAVDMAIDIRKKEVNDE